MDNQEISRRTHNTLLSCTLKQSPPPPSSIDREVHLSNAVMSNCVTILHVCKYISSLAADAQRSWRWAKGHTVESSGGMIGLSNFWSSECERGECMLTRKVGNNDDD